MNKKLVAFPIGLTVKEVRMMTSQELEAEGWDERFSAFPVVLVFDDGSKVYASSDPEGNDSGALFGITGSGNMVMISPISQDMVPESELQ